MAIRNGHVQLIFPLTMVIFYSYVNVYQRVAATMCTTFTPDPGSASRSLSVNSCWMACNRTCAAMGVDPSTIDEPLGLAIHGGSPKGGQATTRFCQFLDAKILDKFLIMYRLITESSETLELAVHNHNIPFPTHTQACHYPTTLFFHSCPFLLVQDCLLLDNSA